MAQFFAETFQEKPYENGFPSFAKYLKAFKDFEPKVIGRAFLVTLVLLHQKGWRVKRRGALFTSQCEILTGRKPLSPHYTLSEVEEWLQMWGGMPYSHLVEALSSADAKAEWAEPASLISDSRFHDDDAPSAQAGMTILDAEVQEPTTGREPEQREVPRSEEQRRNRERFARNVRQQLRAMRVVVLQRDGTDGLEIDGEHRCGCPLYREKGLRRICAHCTPDLSWSQEVKDLIATILEV